jgi:hypothetical protein
VLALVVSLLAVRGADDSEVPVGSSVVERLAHGTWKELDPGPAEVLTNLSSVWTGKELLAFGYRVGATTGEGAAYNPRTERWTRVATPPPWVTQNSVVVWAGDEMLVWGGTDPHQGSVVPRSDGIAYEPRTDAWRSVAPAPFPPDDDTITTWTGRELFVTNGRRAASYDPGRDRWSPEPDSPVALSGAGVTAASIGRAVVYWLASGTLSDRRVVAFDLATHAWIRLAAPFPAGSSGAAALARHVNGVTALQWSSTGRSDGEIQSASGRFPSGRWVSGPTLREPTICDVAASSVPRGAVVFCDPHHLVGLDMTRGRWRRLPTSKDLLPRSVFWTGRELLAFSDGHLLALAPRAA